MDSLKKAVNAYVQEQMGKDIKEENIKATIVKSKQAFWDQESHLVLSYPEFILKQSTYIKKRWWLLQGALLLLLYFLLQITESSFYSKRCTGIGASLFVILIIPELYKNCNTVSTEIESASYFSLRQLYAARMVLFAMVDLSILTLFFVTLGIRGQWTVGEMMTSFFLPFMVSCGICFHIFCSQKATTQYLALFLCMIWTFLWVQIVLNESIYAAITRPVWCIAMVLSLVYFVYSICRVWKSCETIWEVAK